MIIYKYSMLILALFFSINVTSAQIASSNNMSKSKVTILFDAIGESPKLKAGWGYSALVEYEGKIILFDTGGDEEVFANNIKQLGVDLSRLDAVIITHRHGDHTSGLSHVLRVNPKVKIYTPEDIALFASNNAGADAIDKIINGMINRKVDTVPNQLRYFGGNPPKYITPRDGWPTPWANANIEAISGFKEIFPGFYLIQTISTVPGTIEMNEISLAIDTPDGLAMFVGCSHPGIDNILKSVRTVLPSSKFYTLIGGTHLVSKNDSEIIKTIENFNSVWRFKRIAAGHCTGQFGFSELIKKYGSNFDEAGLGTTIDLP
ncbi:MBL fold metallo-hydrolase [Shewanella scandinavica]|uniref:MBL fold metallo-hydrolase n=1 Tax=Shewanella scandinavica TaxID=3063538 RepID=UPI00319932AE